ncbi:MAG: tetratricopeptide repeat protein [Gammaproteobacteria bacterium]|nr:tetratricopeptide repeat protein [Gammaproteobacteria bacterium]
MRNLSAVKLKTLRGEEYRREYLVNVPALISMVVVIGLTLALLFPKKAIFSDPAYIDSPDAISIAYLELLLKSDPDNTELRLSLARQLYVTGQLTQAMSIINLLLTNPPAEFQTQIYNLYIKLIAQRYFASKGKSRRTLFTDLQTAFNQATQAAMTLTELKTVYDMARRWAAPSTQLLIIKKIILLATTPQQKVSWMLEASDLYLAQNHPIDAANWLEQAYQTSTSSSNKPQLATWLLQTLLATGNPNNALQKTPYYVQHNPRSGTLLQLAISIAQQTGRTDLQDRWLTTAVRLEPDNMNYIRELIKLKLATGQVKSAAHLADIRLQHPPLTIEERTRIARLYEWNGEPDKALKQWYWLSMNSRSPTTEAEQRALKLALGLFHYKQAIKLYEHFAKQQPLTLAAQKELTGLYLIQGQTDKVESNYRQYLKQHPQQKDIWAALAGLYVNLQKLPQAAKTYEIIDKRFGLTDKQLLDLKNIYWLLGEAENAQAKLLSHPVVKSADENAYWKARTDIAWFLEDTDQIDDIYDFLLSRTKEQRITLTMLDQLIVLYSSEKEYEKSTQLAMLGWQRSFQPDYAIRALHYASRYARKTHHWNYAEGIARRINNGPHAARLKKNSQYWQSLANIAREQKQWPRAIRYLQQATLLSADNIQLEVSLLWLLIKQHKEDNPQLKTALISSIDRFGQNSSLFDVQASGWAALGQYNIALRWYRKSLARHEQDWPWLLDYAYALQQSGKTLAAWRVRRYILAWMQQHPQRASSKQANRNWEISYLGLLREFKGSANGWKMAKHFFVNKTNKKPENKQTQKSWLTLFSEWSIADNNRSLSMQLKAQANNLQIELPAWQRLGLALQQYDSSAIEALINANQPLPLADKTLALAQNGYYGQALNFGLTHISSKLPENELQALRATTTSIRSQQPNGIKWGLYAEGIADIRLLGQQLRYAHATDNGVMLIDAKTLTTTGQLSLVKQWPEEKNIRLSYNWLSRSSRKTLRLGVDQRVNGSQPEFSFSQILPVYGGLDFKFSIGLQQRSKTTASAYELANWNHLGVASNYQMDSRTSISSQLRWSRYDSVWGDFLGQGIDVDMSINHTLFANAPQWKIYSNIQWTRLNTIEKAPANLQPYFTIPNPSLSTILTDRYGRIGIGSSLQHGIPGIIAHQLASPHWLLDLNAGYQWISGRFDWAFSSGFGWRVFGDDELALTTSYNSDNRGAGSTYTLWLGYNKYFGR